MKYLSAGLRGRWKPVWESMVVRAADDVDAYVGGRVRLRRMALGVSQEQLGDALGLTFQQVQKYEKGQNRIGAGRLYRISQILSTPVAYFYEGLPMHQETDPSRMVSERQIEVQKVLASPEVYELAIAFQQIVDKATRRRLVDLVTTIGREEAG